MNRMCFRLGIWLVAAVAFVSISGCPLTIAPFDPLRLENINEMQVIHQKVVKSHTDKYAGVVTKCTDATDAVFLDAVVYTESNKDDDDTAHKSVSILFEEYSDDCSFISRYGGYSVGGGSTRLLQLIEQYKIARSIEIGRKRTNSDE